MTSEQQHHHRGCRRREERGDDGWRIYCRHPWMLAGRGLVGVVDGVRDVYE